MPDTGCVWNSPYGQTGIWNDFSTNILEIAYPVLERPDQFIELRQAVFGRLQQVLLENELVITPGTVGFRRPDEIVLRPAPSPEYQIRLDKDLQRPANGRELFNPYFYANICATQVSISVTHATWKKVVRGLFEYEHLIPLLYSSTTRANEKMYHCLRHFVLADNWPNDPYVGYPKDISVLIDGVELNPQPRTVKYANCVYRSPDRVEFRSCDRLDETDEILEMTCLRLLTLATAIEFAASNEGSRSRDLYLAACRTGAVCEKTVNEQLRRFLSVLHKGTGLLQQPLWESYIETLLHKLENLSRQSSPQKVRRADVKL